MVSMISLNVIVMFIWVIILNVLFMIIVFVLVKMSVNVFMNLVIYFCVLLGCIVCFFDLEDF